MSQEIDRIPVPTNGKGPHPGEAPTTPPDELEPAPSVAFTPTQLAVGFGIIASLVLFAIGRMRRRNRSRSGGIFGGR